MATVAKHRRSAPDSVDLDPERARLRDVDTGGASWRAWGPYVAERAWGTVREDYSPNGHAWASFPFEHAVSRTYRWNEDGFTAWCDAEQYLCLGLALWNGADPVLKERPFGLSGPQGNHGEDAKDYWWYVDNTPTHSWMRTRYAYPTREFPYQQLVDANAARDRSQPEYELLDTGIFDDDRYLMVTTDWAKAGPADVCMRVRVENRGPETATVHVLPTAWFRNTWSWQVDSERPSMCADECAIRGQHAVLGEFCVTSVAVDGDPPGLLFCENETNVNRLYGADVFGGQPATPYPKDGINDHVVHGAATVNPQRVGTKAAFRHVLTISTGASAEVRVRLRVGSEPDRASLDLGAGFDEVMRTREAEADAFWSPLVQHLDTERAHVVRQAFAGLLSSQQYYGYDVRRWLEGDPTEPQPPGQRWQGRNTAWTHLRSADLILMPDPWEYAWFAAWDLAFHCVAMALVDPALAKEQLLLLLGERFQHPGGQLPAYEWNFSDVNPPVHAWAALQIYRIDGERDTAFLERALHKLLINFTWWVNRKDNLGNNLFEGGFLGLDNIGPFDRSQPLPGGGMLEQSDGTAWMAMFCLDMLAITLQLVRDDHTYDDLAVKFLDHFCRIAEAANNLGLWDAEDGFYYDLIRHPDGSTSPVRVRSMVGLLPLVATARLSDETLDAMPRLAAYVESLRRRRPDLVDAVHLDPHGGGGLLAMCGPEQVARILDRLLDPAEFWSDYGVRSVSAYHREHPAQVLLDGQAFSVDYEPGESHIPLFGGNSNWRGPVWFPVNALLVGGLRRYGEEAAEELSDRLMRIFLPGPDGIRPGMQGLPWQDDVLFHEYFHGDTGAGLGASHQTGWTAMVAALALGWPR